MKLNGIVRRCLSPLLVAMVLVLLVLPMGCGSSGQTGGETTSSPAPAATTSPAVSASVEITPGAGATPAITPAGLSALPAMGVGGRKDPFAPVISKPEVPTSAGPGPGTVGPSGMPEVPGPGSGGMMAQSMYLLTGIMKVGYRYYAILQGGTSSYIVTAGDSLENYNVVSIGANGVVVAEKGKTGKNYKEETIGFPEVDIMGNPAGMPGGPGGMPPGGPPSGGPPMGAPSGSGEPPMGPPPGENR